MERRIITCLLGALFTLGAGIAISQTYPAKPIRIIAPFAPGGGTDFIARVAATKAGIKMVHVPYKGTGPAITDTIAGQTQLLFGSVAVTLGQTKTGRLKPIAVTTAKRIEAAKDVPTVTESGLKGYEVILWHGLIAPKNLPKPIQDRLNSDLNKILQNKDMQDKLAGDGVSAAGGTPEQFGALIKKDIDTWRKVAQKAGVKAE